MDLFTIQITIPFVTYFPFNCYNFITPVNKYITSLILCQQFPLHSLRIYEDILNTPVLDQVQVVKSIAMVEKQIYQSIQNGERNFYKPVKVKSRASVPGS